MWGGRGRAVELGMMVIPDQCKRVSHGCTIGLSSNRSPAPPLFLRRSYNRLIVSDDEVSIHPTHNSGPEYSHRLPPPSDRDRSFGIGA